MLPHKHVIVSTAVAAAGWWGTGEPAMGIAALVAGVLPDIDHAIDYAYYYWRGEHRFILLFHGYEYVILGAMFTMLTQNGIVGISVVSYLLHLLADQVENRTHIYGYLLLFRLWHRFKPEMISTMPTDAIRGRMNDIKLLTGILRRWQA